ncbi:Hypothetical membrane protein [Hoyosella subflava DQS3-9A1]|uniref:Hypothetical membrane protein n=1 Tax=Hoyosella subflava (strain DSM 45089 / JCM 17490 / NBRC 109087 / DQS3-9A1) TaxID=443218 RepID=F6EFQ7_HOYSD|nr:Hypothetical membrane protein [Hoyosella subflava DQS3-9A1]
MVTGSEAVLILGVFIGGAAPWLEAIVVIPAGILAGLHPATALVAGVTGNLLTVALAAWFGGRIRQWWLARKERKAVTDGPTMHKSRRRGWIEASMKRWGLPALAILGPIGLGTQVSAAVAVGMGTGPRAAFVWVGAGTVGWAIVAAALTLGGVSVAGIGN